MNEEEKEILIENLYDSLPATINLKNLLGNEVFIKWFLPRVKLIKEIQRWPQEKIDEIVEIRLTVKASIDVPLGENITTATPIEFEVSGCMVH